MLREYDKEEVIKALKSPTKNYLFFHSNGCGPCKIALPKVTEFAQNKKNVFSILENNNAQLQKYLGVEFFPTLIVVENQTTIYHCSGLKKINDYLNKEWFNGTSNK